MSNCMFLFYKIENGMIKFRTMPTKELPPHSKPWLVALFRKHSKKFTCTGSLIGKTSVLTAAHCCIVQKAALGAHCYDEIDLEEMISIKRFKTFMFEDHDLAKYSPISRSACMFDLDVGVAQLETPANLDNPNIQIGRIADPEIGCSKITLDIAGWGKTKRKVKKSCSIHFK